MLCQLSYDRRAEKLGSSSRDLQRLQADGQPARRGAHSASTHGPPASRTTPSSPTARPPRSWAGPIDWLCVPRFDSAACSPPCWDARSWRTPVALAPRSGKFAGAIAATAWCWGRGYTDEGEVARGLHAGGRRGSRARVVEGVTGRVPMHMELVFASTTARCPWVHRLEDGTCRRRGPDTLGLRSRVPLRGEGLHDGGGLQGRRGGVGAVRPHRAPDPRRRPSAIRVRRSSTRPAELAKWADRCIYEGPWLVVR